MKFGLNPSGKYRMLFYSFFSLLAAYGVFCFVISSQALILDDLNEFKIEAFTDADLHGDSKSYLKINKNKEFENSYTIGYKLVYPYAGIIIKRKNDAYFSSKNSVLSFTAIADTTMRIPVRFNIYVNNFSKKEAGASLLFLEKIVLLEKGINHISIPSDDLKIPSWWYSLNHITEDQLPAYDLAQTFNIAFVNDQLLDEGGTRKVKYKDLSLKKDLTFYHSIALIFFGIGFLLLAIFYFLPLLLKKEIYIPINRQEVINNEINYLSLVKEAIAKSYTNPELRAKHIAKEVGITENKLGAILKEGTSMTFTEYLNFVKIEEAKRLLAETDLPISDIGYQVGFDYPQSFNRVFKKYTSLTPSEFKQYNHLKIRT